MREIRLVVPQATNAVGNKQKKVSIQKKLLHT